MKILVGVSGGIACYKAAELVRALQERGADVQVVMTRAAQEFVKPLTFGALTGKRVLTSLWEDTPVAEGIDGSIEHIAIAQSLDAFVIAPATANVLAQMAQGVAQDYLTTLYLATKAPVFVAPAMNINMWEHAATQSNVATLKQRGVHIISPESGYLACGMQGSGRLAPVQQIAETVMQSASLSRDLEGQTVLINAGGTREYLDPVRYLGNRSSGKMGHALAEAAAERGARVILITASSLPASVHIETIRVATAAEMQQSVLEYLPRASIVILAAAVSDFRPRHYSTQKLRREGALLLELEATEDIASKVVQQKQSTTRVIAFAAETEDLEHNARAKLLRKGVDSIVANDVSSASIGFDADWNAGLYITPHQVIQLEVATKSAFAHRVLDYVVQPQLATTR